MESRDSGWDETEIFEQLRQSNKPLSMPELSHTTKIPYERVYVAIRALVQKNLLSFSLHHSLSLVPGGVRSGNELNYRVKALKVGGKDYKYYWLVDGNDKPVCYIGGGNIKTPLANRYRCLVEAAIKRGEFEHLSKPEIKKLVCTIKSCVEL